MKKRRLAEIRETAERWRHIGSKDLAESYAADVPDLLDALAAAEKRAARAKKAAAALAVRLAAQVAAADALAERARVIAEEHPPLADDDSQAVCACCGAPFYEDDAYDPEEHAPDCEYRALRAALAAYDAARAESRDGEGVRGE